MCARACVRWTSGRVRRASDSEADTEDDASSAGGDGDGNGNEELPLEKFIVDDDDGVCVPHTCLLGTPAVVCAWTTLCQPHTRVLTALYAPGACFHHRQLR